MTKNIKIYKSRSRKSTISQFYIHVLIKLWKYITDRW